MAGSSARPSSATDRAVSACPYCRKSWKARFRSSSFVGATRSIWRKACTTCAESPRFSCSTACRVYALSESGSPPAAARACTRMLSAGWPSLAASSARQRWASPLVGSLASALRAAAAALSGLASTWL